MECQALATDYDGTLATAGRVLPPTLAALQRFIKSGRHLILVTGRELDDLLAIFPEIALFEMVVAENGALLYCPNTQKEKALHPPPPETLVQRLRKERIQPLSIGRVIIASHEPNEVPILKAIHELGLEMQVIFNKGSVMVLPSGINKATGLQVALEQLEIPQANVVAVGDAENDHAFLEWCGFSAAVANALPSLKDNADYVTQRDHGAGVEELIDFILQDNLSSVRPKKPVPAGPASVSIAPHQ